ncbi:MAG: glycosyltransferase [Gemmatimonadales bacterium]|jgi:UDP:flavonoid glycosyltransferase YjiC (YdhE family)
MHVALLTAGSRGDVQPYVALGAGLAAAGHGVRLVTHRVFERSAQAHGLDFAGIGGDPREAVESDIGQSWLGSGENPAKFVIGMAKIMRPLMADAVRDALAACRDTDLILFSPLGWLAAHHVAEKLRLPLAGAYLQPFTPTRSFPPPFARSGWSLGALHNRFAYLVGEHLFWWLFRRSANAARRDILGLSPMPLRAPFPALRARSRLMLYGFSPSVLAPPEDWPASAHVTGYWFLDDANGWEPPEDLVRFLADGRPPVYVGFGSMHARSAHAVTRLVLEALDRAGQRGILLTGWGALTDEAVPDSVYALEHVPHDWLFPRVAAVVHHCGAGTTGAGLRAGVPTVPVPFFADQPFWARCLGDVGVATKPVPFKRLTTKRLATAIERAVGDDRLHERAAAVGRTVRAEDGVGRAVELIEREFGRGGMRTAEG